MRLIDIDNIPSEILDGLVINEKLDLPNTHITVRDILETQDEIEFDNVMQKYQKITEIVDKWHNDPRMKMTTSYYYMAKITEVLEDGNDK